MLLHATAFWSLSAYLVLGRGAFARGFRRVTARLALVAALVALALAPFLTGVYASEVFLFIGGPNAYILERVARAYSGLALGLGAIALALAAAAQWGGRLVGYRVWAGASR